MRGRLLLFLLILRCAGESWLPITLATTPAGDPTLIGYPGVGVPRTERPMSLDFSRGDVLVNYDAPTFSSAYVPLYGTPHDLYQIGEHASMIETVAGPLDTTSKCSVCHGVLGLGLASPIWSAYRSVRVTAKEITFYENSGLPDWDGVVACGFGQTLCETVADVTVGGTAFGTFAVSVPLATTRTQLPQAVYDAVVGTRHPAIDGIAAWPDFCLEWGGTETCFQPKDYIVTSPRGPHLIIEPSPDAVLRLGAGAVLVMELERDIAGGMAILNYNVRLSYSWLVRILVPLIMAIHFSARQWPLVYDGATDGKATWNRILSYVVSILGALAPCGAAVYVGAALTDNTLVIVGCAVVAAVALLFGLPATLALAIDTIHGPGAVYIRRQLGVIHDAVRDVGYAWTAVILSAQVRTVALTSTLGAVICIALAIDVFSAALVTVTLLRHKRTSWLFFVWTALGGVGALAALAVAVTQVLLPGAHWLAPASMINFALTFACIVCGVSLVLLILSSRTVWRVLAWRKHKQS